MKTIKIHMCEGQDEDCEITSDFPECNEALADPGFADPELANKTFYNIVKRSAADPQSKKANIKISVYARVGKRLGLWRDNATKDENVERLKTEIENLPNNEELKEKLLSYKIDVAGLKLDQLVKCNPGSISKKLTCGKFCLGPSLQCLKYFFQFNAHAAHFIIRLPTPVKPASSALTTMHLDRPRAPPVQPITQLVNLNLNL